METALVDEFEISEESASHDASQFDTLGLGRLDTVDLVVLIDRVFGVKIEKSDLSGIKIFGALADLVWWRVKKQDEPPYARTLGQA